MLTPFQIALTNLYLVNQLIRTDTVQYWDAICCGLAAARFLTFDNLDNI